jgi:hypothetical protein
MVMDSLYAGIKNIGIFLLSALFYFGWLCIMYEIGYLIGVFLY